MNMLDDSAAWIVAQLENHAGRTVTYTRGGIASDSFTATLSIRTHHVMDEEGFATAVQSYDWTVRASLLVVSGATITPRPGDRITFGDAVYEAMPLRDGQAWEAVDANGTLLTVHTKRVS